ncbi:hypothetical protein [Oceaniglobus trochenteri]|uniref:hypothetical protein n=1 Tax=Oceaniglobus trochenteri TaxID=2763260 RepID=UPI001CFFA924|nr:hypothetical protein [Oceaniglobus trochenteri]
MSYLLYLNDITALIAFLLMCLVTRGYAPYLRPFGRDASSMIHLFVILTSSLVWCRLLWWDLTRPFLGLIGVMDPARSTVLGSLINGGFNIWAILAGWAALTALHRSLPTDERRDYSFLTVAFYPRRIVLRWNK